MFKKISVIVPIYNVENYLVRCIDSIIYQNYRNLEIILINDGSTDSCGKICDSYAKNDNRIIVIHKENAGQSSARNAGLDICTGDYIAFVDSDDYIHPRTYELCMYIMQKELVDFIEFEYNKITHTQGFNDISLNDYEIHSMYDVLKGRILWNKHYSVVWNKLYNRDFIIKYRFELSKIMEDSILFTESVFSINRVVYLPLKLYYYIQRQGSTMNTNFTMKNIQGLRGQIDLYEKIKQNNIDLYDLQLNCIVNYFNRYFANISDVKVKLKAISVLMSLYDDIMESNIINNNVKNGLMLARKDPNVLIEKYNKGVVRKDGK